MKIPKANSPQVCLSVLTFTVAAVVEKAALELDFVQKALEGRPPRKVIVVPQRIVNVVG